MADKVSPEEFRLLAANNAFVELMDWASKRFETPHLEADDPNTLLPNYGEVYAARAAQYRVMMELKRYVKKHSA